MKFCRFKIDRGINLLGRSRCMNWKGSVGQLNFSTTSMLAQWDRDCFLLGCTVKHGKWETAWQSIYCKGGCLINGGVNHVLKSNQMFILLKSIHFMSNSVRHQPRFYQDNSGQYEIELTFAIQIERKLIRICIEWVPDLKRYWKVPNAVAVSVGKLRTSPLL